MEKIINIDQLTLGVCYYPEHWPENLWESDLERMLTAGIKVIRIAEFAWSEFEPTESVFGGGLFDRFMDLVAKTKMKVIFCTPTATPPAWMSQKYPEILNATSEGVLLRHGLRKHYNYNSEVFRDKTRLIVSHLAKHFGKHPSIIGWQLDNEFNWGIDEYYSEADHVQFRVFLKDKYGCLDMLNKAWGNVFWNQSYTCWEEIYLQRPNVKNQPNPHMALDSKRFFSWSTIRYCKLQYDILRSYLTGDIFITSNGIFDHIDHVELTKQGLDFITHNHYPSFGLNNLISTPEENPLLDRTSSFGLAKLRAVSPVFGVMEQQSGAGGWLSEHYQPAPKPGQMRLWTFQAIGHGADFISYFRWRTCTFGTEMYWHGILDYDNRDNRRIKELWQISADINKIQDITGGRYEAEVGLVYNYDNLWDGELDMWHGPLREISDRSWFVAFQEMHIPFDYVNIKHDRVMLSKYKLLVYPHATVLTQEDAYFLKQYVESGGILITGTRSGYKNENAHCRMEPMPGPLADLFGITVDDFTCLGYLEQDSTATWDSDIIDTIRFNDIISPTTANVLARYNQDYYKDTPALTVNSYGKGKAYYLGSAFNVKTAKLLLNKIGIKQAYVDIIEVPECCEIMVRKNKDSRFMFVLNYSASPVTANIKIKAKSLLCDKIAEGEHELEPFGVLVLEL
ncbi:MAG: beta-galactosidase [Defluviitaleaceae bacterium]|nr:beta-galactosidase [Defluviitaleaceae bacterium]